MANIDNALRELREQEINTWFDLGLFIDRFRERNSTSAFTGDLDEFGKHLEKGGVAFLTFYFTIDGITVETEKYAKTFRRIYPKIPVHYIAGEIKPEADELIPEGAFKKEIKEMDGFDNWPLYDDFFRIKLERGSPEYNALITKF